MSRKNKNKYSNQITIRINDSQLNFLKNISETLNMSIENIIKCKVFEDNGLKKAVKYENFT